jgi:hypothetical protein
VARCRERDVDRRGAGGGQRGGVVMDADADE